MKGTKATIAAVTASATMLIGFTAFTQTVHRPHGRNRQSENANVARAKAETGDDCARLIEWLDQTTFPMLNNALAVPERKFKLERPRLQESPQARVLQTAPCRREWRPLPSGSTGDQATIICPEAPVLQMQPYALQAPLVLKMPGHPVLEPAVTSGHPGASLLPNPKRAAEAGTVALQLLRGQERAPSATDQLPERMPYLNNLGWSIPQGQTGV